MHDIVPESVGFFWTNAVRRIINTPLTLLVSAMSAIPYDGIEPHELLAALYNAAPPRNPEQYAALGSPLMTDAQARDLLDRDNKVECVLGKQLMLDFDDTLLVVDQYDCINGGEGTAKRIVSQLQNGSPPPIWGQDRVNPISDASAPVAVSLAQTISGPGAVRAYAAFNALTSAKGTKYVS